MSNENSRLGGRLILRAMVLAAALSGSSAAMGQSIGSQAANIPFGNQWQVPSSPANINELNDYFSPTANPGYTTLVVMWGIN